jgi:hypothetical protein
MRYHARLKKLEARVEESASFCPACLKIVWTEYERSAVGAALALRPGQVERPAICPDCRRGPGDYPQEMVRGFRIVRPNPAGMTARQA